MQRLHNKINILHQQDKSPAVVFVIMVLISTPHYVCADGWRPAAFISERRWKLKPKAATAAGNCDNSAATSPLISSDVRT